MHLKSAPRFCVGIDGSERTFVAMIDTAAPSRTPRPFEQSESGFDAFHQWLRSHTAQRDEIRINLSRRPAPKSLP